MTTEFPLAINEVLASAIAPVTLITGVAFLTSIMAPRFGRCIDRIRGILGKINGLELQGEEYENYVSQLKILYRRTRRLRNTMGCAGVCILFVVLTIGSTFSNLLFHVPGTNATVITFLLALVWLVILSMGFIVDFLSSLKAVKLEIECELDREVLSRVGDHPRHFERRIG